MKHSNRLNDQREVRQGPVWASVGTCGSVVGHLVGVRDSLFVGGEELGLTPGGCHEQEPASASAVGVVGTDPLVRGVWLASANIHKAGNQDGVVGSHRSLGSGRRESLPSAFKDAGRLEKRSAFSNFLCCVGPFGPSEAA